MSAQQLANDLAAKIMTEEKARQDKIHELASRLNVSYEKALSLIKAEARRKEYQTRSLALAKAARVAMKDLKL